VAVSASRAASPGRALEQVKAKLSEYKRRTEEATWLERSSASWESKAARVCGHTDDWAVSVMPQATEEGTSSADIVAADILKGNGGSAVAAERKGGDELGDTSDEIADIDSRLQALQDFLRSAKARAA
jgi:hypothetical protein